MLMIKKLSWEADIVLHSLTTKGKLTPRLISETGLKRRALMHAVRELRMAGYKVCSGDDGYWLWDGQDDSWRKTKAQIRSRMHSMQELYYAMEGMPIDGQMMMDI